MWIGKTIDIPPLSLRASPFYATLDDQDQCRQQADTSDLKDSPLFPKGVTTDPNGEQTDCPKPGIPGMRKKDGNSEQCAWLFCHAHLTGETSIEIKNGVQIYFSALSLV